MTGRYEKKNTVSVLGMVAVLVLTLILLGITVYPKDTENRGSEQIALRLEDRILVQITEEDRIQEMKALLSAAQDIGFVPKTYMLGPELVYTGPDGTETVLEPDVDSDLFRYDGKFFDYGPGNDNHALPTLLNLLGLTDWPEEVKALYPEWFASPEDKGVPIKETYRQQSVYMDLWYPDWYYVKIPEEYALTILEALRQEDPVKTDREKVPVEQSQFTIHIAYDDGREYDLAYIGEDTFLLWEGGTETVYGFSGSGFRETADAMISLSRELSE